MVVTYIYQYYKVLYWVCMQFISEINAIASKHHEWNIKEVLNNLAKIIKKKLSLLILSWIIRTNWKLLSKIIVNNFKLFIKVLNQNSV